MNRVSDGRQFLWLLKHYVAPYWPAVTLLLAGSYVATALAAVFPVLMAPILDLALGVTHTDESGVSALSLKNLGAAVLQWTGIEPGADRFRAIVWLCVVYVAVGFLKGWIDFGNYLLALWIRVRAAAALQLDLFRHLLTLSMSFFNRQRTGELIARLETDTRSATAGVETLIGTLLTAPVLIAFYGYLLVQTSPKLVLAALGAVALHYGVTRAIRGPIRRLATDQFSKVADVVARLQETLLAIRVVKSFAAERFETRRLGDVLRGAVAVNVRFGVYKHIEEPTRAVVNYVVEAAIIVLAAWELVAGRLGASTFFLFLYVGRAVMVQVGVLGSAYTQTQSVLAASRRVSEMFAHRPDFQDGTETIATFDRGLRFEDVSFHYGAEPVLDAVSFEIRKGDMVAIVGPSGVGKSTIADLVLRFYDPVGGRITIDGRDVRTLTQESYRRLFGVVSQETLLFNGTIRDNIAYGRPGVTPQEIVRAARIANAHDFVMEFRDGYDTVVGDRGVRLSGGQRQRIAIARAIVGAPPILVLDEATSSLDSESERLVQQAIARVVQDATSIIIAHRLSTVLHADKIVLLNHGAVDAVGKHTELISTNDTYARLYKLQFGATERLDRV